MKTIKSPFGGSYQLPENYGEMREHFPHLYEYYAETVEPDEFPSEHQLLDAEARYLGHVEELPIEVDCDANININGYVFRSTEFA